MNVGRDRLSLNTATIKHASLSEALKVASANGFDAVGLWRDKVADVGLANAVALVEHSGLRVSSLCRGGFLTDVEGDAVEENTRALAEAEALGAPELVMVVGGLPDGDRDLTAARRRVADRLAILVPIAEAHGVRLALEPLHPMYCADRAVISTLSQALDLAEPFPAHVVGVVVDTFHVWWDPDLEAQIRRAGRGNRISSYQVCDWNLPIAADALLSRGLMGDGFIDFATISEWVIAAGYLGDIEVEIFNAEIWDRDPMLVAKSVRERYDDLVLPHLAEPLRQ